MQARSGDKVHVHYTGSLEDGTVFDSSDGGEPLVFTIGAGEVVPGFEAAVDGMQVGEKKQAKIDAENAYGERSDELVFSVARTNLPEEIEVSAGDAVRLGLQNGETIEVLVAGVDDESLTLDANHPLAGKTLIFDVELVGIDTH